MCAPPLVMKEPCVVWIGWKRATHRLHTAVPRGLWCCSCSPPRTCTCPCHLWWHLWSTGSHWASSGTWRREGANEGTGLELRNSRETREQKRSERMYSTQHPSIINPKMLLFLFLPATWQKKKNSARPTLINVQTSLFNADERRPSMSRCRNITWSLAPSSLVRLSCYMCFMSKFHLQKKKKERKKTPSGNGS